MTKKKKLKNFLKFAKKIQNFLKWMTFQFERQL